MKNWNFLILKKKWFFDHTQQPVGTLGELKTEKLVLRALNNFFTIGQNFGTSQTSKWKNWLKEFIIFFFLAIFFPSLSSLSLGSNCYTYNTDVRQIYGITFIFSDLLIFKTGAYIYIFVVVYMYLQRYIFHYCDVYLKINLHVTAHIYTVVT